MTCTTGLSMRMGRPSLNAGSTEHRRRKSQVSALSSTSSSSTRGRQQQHQQPAGTTAPSVPAELEPVTAGSEQHLNREDFPFFSHEQPIDGINFGQEGWQNHSTYPDLRIDPAFDTDATNKSYTSPDHAMSGLAMSASDIFDFQLPLTMAESSSSRVEDDPPSILLSTTGTSTRDTDTVPSEHSLDMAQDPPLTIGVSLKDNILHKLSLLSGDLLQDLRRISANDMVESSYAAGSSVLATPPPGQMHNVGRMLEHSEKFLDILQHVADSPSHSMNNLSGSTMATVQYFNHGEHGGDRNIGFDNHTATLSQLLGDGFSTSQLAAGRPEAVNPIAAQTNSAVIRPDVPTMLAILTCYTCLIRLYGRVFSYIQKVLSANPSARQKLLPPLPGLHLCGFRMEQHQNLQLEILSRVSLHMLGRIEKGLEEIGRSCVASGIMEESIAANLLTMITKQNLDVRLNEQHNDEGSLKEITRSIHSLLDVTSRLAL